LLRPWAGLAHLAALLALRDAQTANTFAFFIGSQLCEPKLSRADSASLFIARRNLFV
jgi:hypothetical protein